MDQVYEKIESLATECGRIITGADRSEIGLDEKEGHANFVTKYDRLVQEKIKAGLKDIMPEAGFFGEEGEHDGFPDNEYVFIVDPIDGTTNFIKGLKQSCIAIALVHNKERIYGLVYNPDTGEMFTAKRGGGAFLNGERISVSKQPLDKGIAIFGTAPYNPALSDVAFSKARDFLKRCIDVRRLGSAELDLCFVACGRAEIYFEPELQPWDFAAGSLIVEEAGGVVARWDGSRPDVTKAGSLYAHGSGFKIDPEIFG